jgi:hypothetical protein
MRLDRIVEQDVDLFLGYRRRSLRVRGPPPLHRPRYPGEPFLCLV